MKDEITKSFRTGYIFIDHLLLKELIIYYLSKYIENENKIENLAEIVKTDLSFIEKGKVQTKSLLNLKTDILKETKIVIKTFKKYKLSHKIKDIYRKDKDGLTVNTYKVMYENPSLLEIFAEDHDFKPKEKEYLRLVTEEIYNYWKSELEEIIRKEEKKKEEKSLLEKLKESREQRKRLKEDETDKLSDELKQDIRDTKQERDVRQEKLDMIDKIKELQDGKDLKSLKIIEKYENQVKLDSERIDELKLEKENTDKYLKELLQIISKNRASRRELSYQKREL